MLQNKIYQNFIIEIIKTLLIILFGLSLIAFTVRAVNFLDLIVENGYNHIDLLSIFFIKYIWYSSKFIPFHSL